MESNVIIIAACVPGLRPFVVSISHLVRGTCPRMSPRPDRFVPRYSLNVLSVDENTSHGFNSAVKAPMRVHECSASFASRSDGSLPPQHTIQRETDFAMGWEHV
jgi:hypothetical protein